MTTDPRQNMDAAVDELFVAWKVRHYGAAVDEAVTKLGPAARDLLEWFDANPGPDTPARRRYVSATTRFAELADVLEDHDEDDALRHERVNRIMADLVSLQRSIRNGLN
jgi:hypothetical protein